MLVYIAALWLSAVRRKALNLAPQQVGHFGRTWHDEFEKVVVELGGEVVPTGAADSFEVVFPDGLRFSLVRASEMHTSDSLEQGATA